jgi:hypothetical protein
VTARKFFYVCAGLLMLALSYHVGARTAGAAAPVAQPSEVAVLQGTTTSAQVIPLPVYADGTQALESECSWDVTFVNFQGSACCGPASYTWCYTADGFYNTFETDAFLNAHRGRVINCDNVPNPASPSDVVVHYFIIAVRGAAQPTPTARSSWGQLKSRYAPSHAPTSQTPTNR